MKQYYITAYPYAKQTGVISAPAGVGDDDIDDYIIEHWNNINFNDPELDYAGTDFDVEESQNGD